MWNVILAILGIGSTLYGAKQTKDMYDDAAAEAIRIGTANAKDLIDLTEKNKKLSKATTKSNAESVVKIGYANASSIEEANRINASMVRVAGLEEDRQLELHQYRLIGETRAQISGSGVSVHTGTPLHHVNSLVFESDHARSMTTGFRELSLMSQLWQAEEKADLMRLEADEKSAMMIRNDKINSQIVWNEALARSNALKRGADMIATTMRIQGDAACISGIGNALQWGARLV